MPPRFFRRPPNGGRKKSAAGVIIEYSAALFKSFERFFSKFGRFFGILPCFFAVYAVFAAPKPPLAGKSGKISRRLAKNPPICKNSGMRQKIVIGSGNNGKIREIRAALAPLGAELPSLADFNNAAQTAEPHSSFIENALAKARAAAALSGCAAVSDDSGLVVPALGGAPGVRSARYSGENAADSENNQKLLSALAEVKDRRAFYYAAVIFVESPEDPAPIFAEGFWRGEILRESRGENGFGYDPVFYDPAAQKTGAEMSAEEKNAASHRGQSMRELIRLLKKRRPTF